MIEETIRHKGHLYLAAKGLTVTELTGAIQAAIALIDYLDDTYLAGPVAEADDKLHRLYADHSAAIQGATAALRAVMRAGK